MQPPPQTPESRLVAFVAGWGATRASRLGARPLRPAALGPRTRPGLGDGRRGGSDTGSGSVGAGAARGGNSVVVAAARAGDAGAAAGAAGNGNARRARPVVPAAARTERSSNSRNCAGEEAAGRGVTANWNDIDEDAEDEGECEVEGDGDEDQEEEEVGLDSGDLEGDYAEDDEDDDDDVEIDVNYLNDDEREPVAPDSALGHPGIPDDVVMPSQFFMNAIASASEEGAVADLHSAGFELDYDDEEGDDEGEEVVARNSTNRGGLNFQIDGLDDNHDSAGGDFTYYDEDISGASALTVVPKHRDPAEQVFGAGTFAALGLSSDLCTALADGGITRPTRPQVRGIPPALGGADVILGAATGSGKTLAYLLPVIEAMKAAELLRREGEPPLRVPRRPRTVVIVPTRELADQVLGVAKSISHAVKFRVIGANTGPGGTGLTKLKELLSASPVDILVTTTGRLLQLLDMKAIDLRFTRHIIVDEVDTMFDVGFGPELRKILSAARGRGDHVNKAQYIAVGATHPTAAEEMYAIEFPGAKRIDVDLHVTPPGLEARFIRTTAEGKIPELVALLGECKADGHLRGGRVIIFCNTISSARFVGHFLSESGYTTSCIHGDIPPDRRNAEFSGFKTGETQLLVCTDIAARGLDNLEIAHVIIFDFPTSAVDYIHRAGRTARAGATGRVTSLVLKRDLALARAVEKSAQERNDALVSARIAREEERARKLREENDRRDRERIARDAEPEGSQGYPSSPGMQSRFLNGTRGGRTTGNQSDGRVAVSRTRARGSYSRGASSNSRGRGKTYGAEVGGSDGYGIRSPSSSRGRGASSRGRGVSSRKKTTEFTQGDGPDVGPRGNLLGDGGGRTFSSGSNAWRGRGQARGANRGRRGQRGSSRGAPSGGRHGGAR